MDALVKSIIDTEAIADKVLQNKGHIYTFLNPVSYLDARNHMDLFQHFDGIFADGKLMVDAIKLLYGENVLRRSFDMTSIADELFHYAADKTLSIYIVASTEDEVRKSVYNIKCRYPNIQIAGYRSGYFMDSKEQDDAIKNIVNIVPDFLIVGMGVIKQEEFLLEVKRHGYHGIGFTCGGFVSQTATKDSKMDYYPKWIDKYNIRFLYRMYKEPHTRKRYLKAGLLFPLAMIVNRLAIGKDHSGGG